ncbi:cytochrome c biogenesis CcdA family protein [Methylopila musalis]|uniref:Cytochrome c biogenesis CcdA family protein n=1 Tax=Methylopila musalis TaxID=1134781 RepID=A0ABW3Z421_9HYPH
MAAMAPTDGETIPLAPTTSESVADCTVFPKEQSRSVRIAVLAGAGALGVAAPLVAAPAFSISGMASTVLIAMAFAGGLLSTWSPCGYSSLCLLRPHGRYSARALAGFTPAFVLHGLGYALGAVILGGALGVAGSLIGFSGATAWALVGLGVAGLIYGAHQLGFLRVPYPQRRAQVPHDARQRFPMWFIGALYGLSLGLNYLTYVQTPILYLVTAAAALSGEVTLAIALFAVFNAGRFLPMAVNYLPVSDIAVQNWLARRQESAATLDGALLVAGGAALLTLAAL